MFPLLACMWLNFNILSLLECHAWNRHIHGRRRSSSSATFTEFTPALPNWRSSAPSQAECWCPSKVPFRAPIRNAVHSESVNDSTGPARSLEFRTSTDRPTKATSTQSPLTDASLFRHSMLDPLASAMRLSFAQAKKLRAVDRPPCEMSMCMPAVYDNCAVVDLIRRASTAGAAMNARHPCTVSGPMINTNPPKATVKESVSERGASANSDDSHSVLLPLHWKP
jgi:hypothetical protein